MDEKQLKRLRGKNPEEIRTILMEFNSKHADLFNLAQFHINDVWHVLWRAVFDILGDVELAALHPLCLNTIRILTRDEHSLQTHDIVADLKCLLELAQLTKSESAEDGINVSSAATIVEALKCLCNLVYQHLESRRQCLVHNATDAILKRVASSMQQPCVLELYDMKLLFLLTALEPAARNRVQIDLNGVTYMTEWLDEKLQDEADMGFNTEQLELLAELLKVLFNVTSHSADKSPHNANEIQSLHLTGVLRDLLLRFGDMRSDKERQVVMHGIHLLNNIPDSCLGELLQSKSQPPIPYEGHNVRVLDILLQYLRLVLDEQQSTAGSYEIVQPVLTVIVKCARSKRVMRHYIRSKVLPPLRDVSQRPEVGNELRNYLCRFLTLPDASVRDLAAELLFVCCKENVTRMIKYTGYGNAAGLFAKRGVLDCRAVDNEETYSSDSDDSDTEEYKAMQHGINPVVGCFEPPKPNPLAGMSEEQQEYEAEQLAILMDKLHRTGVMQPCRISEDGKPQPIDHILQLQEELPQQQFEHKRKT